MRLTVAALIVRFIRLTRPLVHGWFGLVSRCAIPFASQIMSKRICREHVVFRFRGLVGELDAVIGQVRVDAIWDVLEQTFEELPRGLAIRLFRECPIFCVTGVWSMLPERSNDDDHFQGTSGRTSEGLRAA